LSNSIFQISINERVAVSENIFFISNLSLIAQKIEEINMSQNDKITNNEKKESSGIWALLLFAVLFIGAIILGWLCR
jgi:hypothetical protein